MQPRCESVECKANSTSMSWACELLFCPLGKSPAAKCVNFRYFFWATGAEGHLRIQNIGSGHLNPPHPLLSALRFQFFKCIVWSLLGIYSFSHVSCERCVMNKKGNKCPYAIFIHILRKYVWKLCQPVKHMCIFVTAKCMFSLQLWRLLLPTVTV